MNFFKRKISFKGRFVQNQKPMINYHLSMKFGYSLNLLFNTTLSHLFLSALFVNKLYKRIMNEICKCTDLCIWGEYAVKNYGDSDILKYWQFTTFFAAFLIIATGLTAKWNWTKKGFSTLFICILKSLLSLSSPPIHFKLFFRKHSKTFFF